MRFALATIRHGGKPTPVIEVGGSCFLLNEAAPEVLQPAPARGLMNLFDDWQRSEEKLLDVAADIGAGRRKLTALTPRVDDVMTPLQYPAKLLLGGANYYEHMWTDAKKPGFRKDDGFPVFFLKPPTTSLVGCGKTVRYPAQSKKFDWEIELAVIIGKRLKRASEAEARDGIAAYAVGIDLSARDWQMNPRHPWKFDLFAGKAFDDSCPLGPKLVPARFVDPDNLWLRLSVNGVVRQNANTNDMIWPAAEQVSLISEHLTLEPGDVLLTGTPAGVGLASDTYLKPGDKIEAEIEHLGKLQLEIVPDPTPLVAGKYSPTAG